MAVGCGGRLWLNHRSDDFRTGRLRRSSSTGAAVGPGPGHRVSGPGPRPQTEEVGKQAGVRRHPTILFAAALVGVGSSVFPPDLSRVARIASGGLQGSAQSLFAQSLFQVGGSTGSAIGPLLAAFIVVPRGQSSIAWFSTAALLAILLLANVRGGSQ